MKNTPIPNETESSTYDSRAVATDDVATILALRADGFEIRSAASGGVIYMRKHVDGPVNPGDGKWIA